MQYNTKLLQIMPDKLLFVQFLHPGGEHRPCDTTKKHKTYHICWNRGDHKRKFLKNPGIYLENDCPKNSDLVFWGEWEPQSDVIKYFDENRDEYPKYLYQPYYSIPINQKDLQNTDPFIFGKQFHYVCCQQDSNPQLKALKRGSVILFGSHKSKKFFLDTVFIVDKYYDIELNNNSSIEEIKNKVTPAYFEVTLSRLIKNRTSCGKENTDICAKNNNYRLYFGATFDNQVNGMFSFFPCLVYKKDTKHGFNRPIIEIPDVINHGMTQGVKYTPSSKLNAEAIIQDNYDNWQQVKKQVEDRELKIGISTKLPTKK